MVCPFPWAIPADHLLSPEPPFTTQSPAIKKSSDLQCGHDFHVHPHSNLHLQVAPRQRPLTMGERLGQYAEMIPVIATFGLGILSPPCPQRTKRIFG